MTDTVLTSASREVVIGFDRPFVIIGERINPTGRKALAEEMKAGDFSRVERDVLAQVEAGAQMLDVNAGIPLADEPAILAKTIQLVQSLTDLPLSIDSSIVEALEAGLAVYQGKALVNSVTGEEERMERVLPLIRKYGAAVVAKDARRSSKVVLHPRFQVAIDKAANRAGMREYNAYIGEWRKTFEACGDDLEAVVKAEAERLETEYTKHHLAELMQSGGVAGGPALPPATTAETSAS